MGTFLFDDIVFGPVKSRRLGLSLGINIFPERQKICSYNCVYCECGWTDASQSNDFVSSGTFEQALQIKCQELLGKNVIPDALTFAGNGESTLHPEFYQIMQITVKARDRFFPQAKVTVLSNFQNPWENQTNEALLLSDRNILKLDSAIQSEFELINQPAWPVDLGLFIEKLQNFKGGKIIQTLFLRGEYKGNLIDNTSAESVEALLNAINRIQPEGWMIYPLDRATPASHLEKLDAGEMDRLAALLRSKTSIPISVYY